MSMKIAILGFGQRGFIYANIIREFPEDMELAAVCEINPAKKPVIMQMFGVQSDRYFENEDEFFAQGKLADILIISTMDRDHYREAMKALDLGYDLLLEKPIAVSKKEILAIRDKAKQLHRKIAVAHVLRYTPFYQKLKSIIDSGTIGTVMTVSQIEHVGYLHYAHSYVRGNWRDTETSAPMVLAKSCHDLDIIRYLIGSSCTKLNSFGKLSYFTSDNAPQGSAGFCYQCPVKENCPYNALEFYRKNPMWMMIFSLDTDPERVLSDESIRYGRCVWKCDNNAVDHQTVNMEFANGATAVFTMTAFSAQTHRFIKIHGSLGEIEGDLEAMKITVRIFGKEEEVIDVSGLADDFSWHAGGDKKMLVDFVRHVRDGVMISGLTDISHSIESHFMALDAEESRLHGGITIAMHYE